MPAAPQTKRPRFGARKDLLRAGSDFDEPLADFAPYVGWAREGIEAAGGVRALSVASAWEMAKRAARSEVVVYGVFVDAKDAEAVAFYEPTVSSR